MLGVAPEGSLGPRVSGLHGLFHPLCMCIFSLSPRISKSTFPASDSQSPRPLSLHDIVGSEANSMNPKGLLEALLSPWSCRGTGHHLKGMFQGNGSEHLPFAFLTPKLHVGRLKGRAWAWVYTSTFHGTIHTSCFPLLLADPGVLVVPFDCSSHPKTAG